MKENTLKFNFIIIITTLLNLTMLTVNDKQTTTPSILSQVNFDKK